MNRERHLRRLYRVTRKRQAEAGRPPSFGGRILQVGFAVAYAAFLVFAIWAIANAMIGYAVLFGVFLLLLPVAYILGLLPI